MSIRKFEFSDGLKGRTLENGAIVLPISLILLVLITIVTLYASRVGMLEIKTSANKVRQIQALAAAEAGVEQGIMYINQNRRRITSTAANGWMNSTSSTKWASCSNTMTAIPCGDGTNNLYGSTWLYISNITNVVQPSNDTGNYTLHFLTPCRDSDTTAGCDAPTQPYLAPPITVVAESTTADQTGRAVAKQAIFFFEFGGGDGAAPVPLMAPGTIGTSGNFSVVANPNGGGEGVPLSAWSNSNITLSASAVTCQLGTERVGSTGGSGFLGSDSTYLYQTDDMGTTDTGDDVTITMCAQCRCNASVPDDLALSASGGSNIIENYDILDRDSNTGVNPDSTYFPSDMFEYVFGVPTAQYQTIKSQATILADCSTLNTTSYGLYWITGDCNPPGDVGSFAHPVLLVVEGNSKINSNNYMFGVLFAFSSVASTTMSVDLNGTPTVYGAIMSNANVSLSNGNYKMRFDIHVLTKLADDASSRGIGKVVGTWRDF
jgi:hypothetical protein